jgi:hypothetical protein
MAPILLRASCRWRICQVIASDPEQSEASPQAPSQPLSGLLHQCGTIHARRYLVKGYGNISALHLGVDECFHYVPGHFGQGHLTCGVLLRLWRIKLSGAQNGSISAFALNATRNQDFSAG